MNTLKAMESFVAVAEYQGFAPAARTLGVSTTAVSRYVQEFEDWLGVELFRRTTRKVTLTEHGQQQLERCKGILNDVAGLQSEVRETYTDLIGTLRVTAPVLIAKRFLTGVLPGFLNTYPELDIDMLAVDREVNLISEGIDVAVRIGKLADSTLIARKLRDIKLEFVCSPDYVARHGEPENLKDLSKHNCLVDTVPDFGNRWPVTDASMRRNFHASGNVRVNNGEIVEALALDGIGIACLPDFFVQQHIAEGRLVRLLQNVDSPALGIYLVYPQTRHISPKVRAFIDFLTAHTEQLQRLYSGDRE